MTRCACDESLTLREALARVRVWLYELGADGDRPGPLANDDGAAVLLTIVRESLGDEPATWETPGPTDTVTLFATVSTGILLECPIDATRTVASDDRRSERVCLRGHRWTLRP